ncbi:MAG TPA: MFS transporter [Ktedonobacteraceae bacterium]|nr:MFS transporter [Ktedonobacteraceae bacterium]
MDVTAKRQETQTHRAPHMEIGLSFFAFILIGANDGALGVLLPSLRAHYHIDDATIGLVFFASAIGYLLSSFNNGPIIERLGNRRALMLGSALFVVTAVGISFMPPFPLLLIIMLFLGAAVASLDAGLNAYIASLPNNTTWLNYLHAFYGVGAWLGPALASILLALSWGWNHVYLIWAGVSLLVLIGLLTIFKQQPSRQRVEGEKQGHLMVMTLKLRVVWLAAILLLFYTGTEVSIGSWSYTLLTEGRHGAPLISGWIVSGYWLGLTLGRVALGHVAQKVGQARLIQASLLVVILGLLLVWFAPVEAVSAVGLFITGFGLGPIFPTVIALTSTLVSARILPAAVGFLASFASAGASLFSWLAGNIAQHISLSALLPYEIALTLCMIVLWIMLPKRPVNTSSGYDTMPQK